MNLTPAEHYRLHGKLLDPHIEELLDVAAALEKAQSVEAYISEAKAQYPEEDVMRAHHQALFDLAKHLRGPNRAALLKIAADLQTVIDDTRNSAEYGREELDKALAALAGK